MLEGAAFWRRDLCQKEGSSTFHKGRGVIIKDKCFQENGAFNRRRNSCFKEPHLVSEKASIRVAALKIEVSEKSLRVAELKIEN